MFLPRTLYFIHSPVCDACAVAEPELDRFLMDHPTVFGFKLNYDAPNASGLTRLVKGTPGYVITESGVVIWKHVGVLKTAQLEKLWQKIWGV